MSLDADTIVDRRRLRRKVTFWRVVAVLLVIAGVAAAVALARPGGELAEASGNYIARLTIQGLIRGDEERVESLERLGKSRVRAVIIHVDSPGGTTAGAEQLYQALRRLAAKKPTVVVVDALAASGGYIAAMSADHIISQDTSLVGSIGVLFQYPNFSDLLKTVGVKVEEIKSSPLKAAPNGYEPTSPEARAAIEAIVADSYAWFRDLVKTRRNLDEAELNKVSWTTRKRLFQDTVVVLTTVVLLTVFLFAVDLIWFQLLSSRWIGVIQTPQAQGQQQTAAEEW